MAFKLSTDSSLHGGGQGGVRRGRESTMRVFDHILCEQAITNNDLPSAWQVDLGDQVVEYVNIYPGALIAAGTYGPFGIRIIPGGSAAAGVWLKNGSYTKKFAGLIDTVFASVLKLPWDRRAQFLVELYIPPGSTALPAVATDVAFSMSLFNE